MQNIIDIKNLTKSYPNFTLDSINMSIPYGEIVGLIGENGAGKTTLINLLLNKLYPQSGEISIFGLKYNNHEIKIKQNIGFVIDGNYFHECLGSKEINNIMKHIYENWSTEVFSKLLNDLKIPKDIEISKMSKGNKKKLMLAIALAHKPKLLILDEITSGLDPVIRDDILEILKQYIKNKDTTILFSTHITSDLDKIATKVAFLHMGKLIFYENMNNLKEKYRMVRYLENDYIKTNKDIILGKYKRDGYYHVLIDSKDIQNEKNLSVRTPNLDDIMLAYIKGDEVNVRID